MVFIIRYDLIFIEDSMVSLLVFIDVRPIQCSKNSELLIQFIKKLLNTIFIK